tara:strand:- start:6 stop:377 length:372 start_codon:yes stop_codon:yes gene_type:complete
MMNRALIIRKEYLDQILGGDKVWEMRTSRTKVRGRIGLIEQGSGLIVGEVDLIDSLDAIGRLGRICCFDFHRVKDLDLLKKWKYPWVLSNPVRYKEPMPYTHPKGAVIWVKVDLDHDANPQLP